MNRIALIPTYQPTEDLFLNLINEVLEKEFLVVVVNDGSDAKYDEIFAKLPAKVAYLHYEKNHGKGYALKTGLKYIKENFNGDYVVVTLDSDGQHKVSDALKIADIAEQNQNALVLGSRKLDENAPPKSRFGNSFAKTSFLLTTRVKVNDTQTGLRAFSNNLIEKFIDINGSRYEYEMNVLLYCTKANIEIIEEFIEVIYIDGNKNTHYQPFKDSMKILFELLKFSLSSLAGFLVDYALFSLILWLPFQFDQKLVFANVVARIISASVNFTINYKIVFKGKKNLLLYVLEYAILAIFILTCNTRILTLIVNDCGLNQQIAKLIVEGVMFIVSWLVQRFFIFKKD